MKILFTSKPVSTSALATSSTLSRQASLPSSRTLFGSPLTVACRDFLERSGFETDKNLVGPKLFGFQCDAVQEHLVSMREPQPEAAQALELKTRGAMERDPLKAVVGRLAASVKESLTGSASSSASSSPAQASSSDDIKVFPVSACEPVCAHSVNFDLIKRSVC